MGGDGNEDVRGKMGVGMRYWTGTGNGMGMSVVVLEDPRWWTSGI